jgi:hypothetical protein
MIEFHGHNLLIKYAPEDGSILELGNQIMNLENIQGISAKEYYTKLGFEHVSLDQNGKDGAVKVDLSSPLKWHHGYFDIITDFGTSEHVSDLYECLSNVLRHAESGTIIIHKNPKTGNFPMHGNHFFTLEFWKEYASICNLFIEELYEHAIYHNTIDGYECIAIFKFTDVSTIITKEEFDTISYLIKKS